MNKCVIIFNPRAGKKKSLELMPIIKDYFNQHKEQIEIIYKISEYKSHIKKIVTEYLSKGIKNYVVVGGDGTLAELVNVFDFGIHEDITIGIIPSGSGNDFIKTLSSEYTLETMMASILNHRTKKIDLGKVNGTYYINSCTFGIDGPIIQTTDKLKSFFKGNIAYLMSTIYAGILFKSKKVHLVTDAIDVVDNMLIVAVNNGKFIGSGMNICPRANLSDGYLELCTISNLSKLKFSFNMNKIYSGKLDLLPEVQYHKTKSVSISVIDDYYWINADGNLIGKTPARISIESQIVQVYLP